MNPKQLLAIAALSTLLFHVGCADGRRAGIVEKLGEEGYYRLMQLSLEDFDQSSTGFRSHSGDYDLICLLIPEYIEVNGLPEAQSRNLRWHLGQIHAFNDNNKDAVAEMEKSYAGGSESWKSYVRGTIAFLEGDKPALKQALETLAEQEYQMNIDVLERLLEHFDGSYFDAYNGLY